MGETRTQRPILFSGEMVRAILEARKTQTRRVIKPQPVIADGEFMRFRLGDSATPDAWVIETHREETGGFIVSGGRFTDVRCPYGQPGDRLWVREAFCYAGTGKRDGTDRVAYRATEGSDADCWKPSIHMPRWASRITLEITKVRVERVQEISAEDAWEEGCWPMNKPHRLGDPQQTIDAYRELWDSINAKRGFGWEKNPFVWVIEFTPVARGGREG